jgi:hypothetical protein
MAGELTARERARVNRKHILEALHSETGSWGGEIAAERVKAYCRNPVGADTVEFGYVGALTLRRFYIDPAKPNGVERRSLWTEIKKRMEITAADPGGWDGASEVMMLQATAEEA